MRQWRTRGSASLWTATPADALPLTSHPSRTSRPARISTTGSSRDCPVARSVSPRTDPFDAVNTTTLPSPAAMVISSAGPSPTTSNGLSSTIGPSYSPGRTTIRSPGRAARTAASTAVKSPRPSASTTCTRTGRPDPLPAGAASPGIPATLAPVACEPGSSASRTLPANAATARRLTGSDRSPKRSSRQSAYCRAASSATSSSPTSRPGASNSGTLIQYTGKIRSLRPSRRSRSTNRASSRRHCALATNAGVTIGTKNVTASRDLSIRFFHACPQAMSFRSWKICSSRRPVCARSSPSSRRRNAVIKPPSFSSSSCA